MMDLRCGRTYPLQRGNDVSTVTTLLKHPSQSSTLKTDKSTKEKEKK